MATNKNISVAELDFDAIKLNLKTFLQGQDAFKDYDFEGSGMAVLLDILAYNTHYNALYTNLAVNEAFLDSASKRSSVVSRAKEIGYIPYSATAPKAIITMTLSATLPNPPAILTLPAYSAFTTVVDGVSYSFYNAEDMMATLDGSSYTFNNITIMEGTPLTFKYIAAQGVAYIIPNANVDLATLQVRVQDSVSSGTFTTFTRNEEIITLTGTSPAYFVKEIENQFYELEFGNDIVGKALSNGNVVNLTYMTTNMDAANGARVFTYSGPALLTGATTPAITTLTPAYGGSNIETIDSIRYAAPRAYSAQNRAVTVDDYKAVITNKFTEAKSVNVWGGEDNVPPSYGKVYLSIKPKTTDILTDIQKQYILNDVLKTKKVVSITPEIVDPEYINLEVSTSVYYNPRLTTYSAADIQSLVIQTIKDYNDQYLNSFSGIFKFSNLSSKIDATEPSITSNITTVKLHREVQLSYNINSTYTVNLGNPIYFSGVPEQSILSTGFYIQGDTKTYYLEDLPTNTTTKTGVLRLFYYDLGAKSYVRNLGTIDYKTGAIIIAGLNITGIDQTYTSVFELVIKPQSNDVVSVRNQLVTIPDYNIFVTAIVDTLSIGDAAGGANYTFTSSRN